MKGVYRIKDRGIQILQLLKTYGPLSFRGIKRMLEPEIKDRRLHDALARFVKNNLVTKRFEKLFRGYGVFYQLSQSEPSKTKLSQILQCEVQELSQPYFRSRDLLHAESCALWQWGLQKCLPDATIIRDYQFNGSNIAHEVLLTNKNEFELLPDLLVSVNSTSSRLPTTIAIEVEKTLKAKRRLQEKLKKYTDGTALDGLIYVCESDEIKNALDRIYSQGLSKKSRRIGHYGDYFILYSDEELHLEAGDIKMSNSKNESVSVQKWIAEMMSQDLPHRRNHSFQLRAGSCSQS